MVAIAELLSLASEDLPKSDKGIVKKADREHWRKRQRESVKGKTFKYHISSFPAVVQRALGIINPPVLDKSDTPTSSEANELELFPYYEVSYPQESYGRCGYCFNKTETLFKLALQGV